MTCWQGTALRKEEVIGGKSDAIYFALATGLGGLGIRKRPKPRIKKVH